VLGRAELDHLLAERERLNEDLKRIIDEQTEPWDRGHGRRDQGREIPEAMQRAMARQAEAERERRAKVIGAEGEYQAAEKLAAAGSIIGESPAALQLRYLQSLAEVGGEGRSTIVFPVPVDMLKGFLDRDRAGDGHEHEHEQLWSSGS
jgi:regulator of protease activity HflC (stomatin/prohibitin superfamily)